jgi:A/G-specific adenine glycosylase
VDSQSIPCTEIVREKGTVRRDSLDRIHSHAGRFAAGRGADTIHPMPSTTAELDSRAFPAIRRALPAWYRRHSRPLPWRATRDPYRIWISEIMLQQTTVVAVIPYFERFLSRFPTVEALALAPEDDVLRLWEGLGYYSRARNIHRAAQIITSELGSRFPDRVEALQDLPGIGRYTAGAIASFAFDKRAPIVEANTLRLYCRLLGYRGDPRSADGQQRLWEFAEAILPRNSPGTFNQALMELGATVCTPAQPKCDACPLRRHCATFALGAQEEIPQAARRPTITEVAEVAVVVERGGRFLLLRRPAGERWAGLWDFVRFPENRERPASASSPRRPREAVIGISDDVERASGVVAEIGEQLTVLRHSVTRYRITLRCYRAEWREGEPARESRWVSPSELTELPLSVTGRKIARLLQRSASP